MFKVYCITNLQNGKRYIGYTSLPLHQRWSLHNTSGSPSMLISRAIQKYGPESFSIELIQEFDNKLDAIQHEILLISSTGPEYNIHRGGTGGPMFGDTNGMWGRTHSEEWKVSKRDSMLGSNNHMFGRIHSTESKALMSRALQGRPAHNKGKPIHPNRLAAAKKPKTEEHKSKLRKTYVINGTEIVINARQYCETHGYSYIRFTQAARYSKLYRGMSIAIKTTPGPIANDPS